jgi:hypothetical protein
MFRCISGDKLPLLVISAVSGSYREADVGTAHVGRREKGKREEVGALSVEDDGNRGRIGGHLHLPCKRETWAFASTSRTTREGEGCRIEGRCTVAVPGSRIKISNNILNLGRRGRGLDVSHRY